MKSKCRILVLCAMILGWLYLPVFAGGINKPIDSNGTWTDAFTAEKGSRTNVSINPETSPVMTITLQRKLPGDAAWGEHVVKAWDLTAASVDQEYTIPNGGVEPERCEYKIGCDVVGDYTSGNCTVRLGGGRR